MNPEGLFAATHARMRAGVVTAGHARVLVDAAVDATNRAAMGGETSSEWVEGMCRRVETAAASAAETVTVGKYRRRVEALFRAELGALADAARTVEVQSNCDTFTWDTGAGTTVVAASMPPIDAKVTESALAHHVNGLCKRLIADFDQRLLALRDAEPALDGAERADIAARQACGALLPEAVQWPSELDEVIRVRLTECAQHGHRRATARKCAAQTPVVAGGAGRDHRTAHPPIDRRADCRGTRCGSGPVRHCRGHPDGHVAAPRR